MGKGTGKFWLGKGTLGNVRQNGEIPEGYIPEDRMKTFEKEGLIGKMLKPSNDDEAAELKAKIKELENSNADLVARIKELEKPTGKQNIGAGKKK